MKRMKVIETEYNGYRFRSRSEARWAVFFDACNLRWEYEPEGFLLRNNKKYLPDFLLHDVGGRLGVKDLYVEVKGKMNVSDARKIRAFDAPILVVSPIPPGDKIENIEKYCREWGKYGFPHFAGGPYPFNFQSIDGDFRVAHPGVNNQGKFELFTDGYTFCRNDKATLKAFKIARQARFEFGETPKF